MIATYLIITIMIIAISISGYAMAEQRCVFPPCDLSLGVGGGKHTSEMLLFDNLASYIAYENSMKANLNFPLDTINYATGEINRNAVKTTDYAVPFFNPTSHEVAIFVDGYAPRGAIELGTLINKTDARALGFVFEDIVEP